MELGADAFGENKMHQWYLSYGGEQIGPLDQGEAAAKARNNSSGLCWRQGFAEWLPISQVDELSGGGTIPAPPPASGSTMADEIDFKIFGEDMPGIALWTPRS